jgi:hypothetical protein
MTATMSWACNLRKLIIGPAIVKFRTSDSLRKAVCGSGDASRTGPSAPCPGIPEPGGPITHPACMKRRSPSANAMDRCLSPCITIPCCSVAKRLQNAALCVPATCKCMILLPSTGFLHDWISDAAHPCTQSIVVRLKPRQLCPEPPSQASGLVAEATNGHLSLERPVI